MSVAYSLNLRHDVQLQTLLAFEVLVFFVFFKQGQMLWGGQQFSGGQPHNSPMTPTGESGIAGNDVTNTIFLL